MLQLPYYEFKSDVQARNIVTNYRPDIIILGSVI